MKHRIPKKFHAVWLGPKPAPAALLDTWPLKNPGWELQVWTRDTGWPHQAAVDAMVELNGKSDLLRWAILHQNGGVYVDADTECLHALPDSLLIPEAWAPWENETAVPGLMATCVLGARKGAPFFAHLLEQLDAGEMNRRAQEVTGPIRVTKIANAHPELEALPARSFCPCYYDGTPAPGRAPVHGKHHWAGTANLRRDADGRWLDHRHVEFDRRLTETLEQAESLVAHGLETPIVSVVIPCYQQAHFLQEAVRSVQAQTVRNLEIVIAASDAESWTVARTLAKEDRRIRTLIIEPRGLGDARNQAIAVARGQYILPLDADDILDPSFLAKTIERAHSGARYCIVSTYVQEFGDSDHLWPCAPFENILEANAMCCCSLFTRALWEDVGGYEVAMLGYEDWDFWIKASELQPVVRNVPEPLFRYRVHGASMMRWDARVGADAFHRAMIRLRHPSLYAAERLAQDRALLRLMPDRLVDRLEQRAALFPHHHGLRSFRAMVHGRELGLGT